MKRKTISLVLNIYGLLVEEERSNHCACYIEYQTVSLIKKNLILAFFWWFSLSKNILERERGIFIWVRKYWSLLISHFSNHDQKHISQNNQYVYHVCYVFYLVLISPYLQVLTDLSNFYKTTVRSYKMVVRF